jgi:hypothetical protein
MREIGDDDDDRDDQDARGKEMISARQTITMIADVSQALVAFA